MKILIAVCIIGALAGLTWAVISSPVLFGILVCLMLLGSLVYLVRAFINRLSMTPLMMAAAKGDTAECAELLSRGIPVDSTSAAGDSALIFAALACKPDTVAYLISRGASPKVQGMGKRTPLHAAVDQKDSANQVPTIQAIIQAHPEIDLRDACSKTALMHAVTRGNVATVRVLVQNGADVNARWSSVEEVSEGTKNRVFHSILRSAPYEPKEIREILLAAGATETEGENW
jgi:ankyrin repeat protein